MYLVFVYISVHAELYQVRIRMYYILHIGYLCGSCNEGFSVSALFLHCQDCNDGYGALIALLSKSLLISLGHMYIIYVYIFVYFLCTV